MEGLQFLGFPERPGLMMRNDMIDLLIEVQNSKLFHRADELKIKADKGFATVQESQVGKEDMIYLKKTKLLTAANLMSDALERIQCIKPESDDITTEQYD